MIRPMTERGLPIAGGAPACPFVAFESDMSSRSSAPDHDHRCYAEPTPGSRAHAHQDAYCLSSAFPVCPTFQDWARREAAATRAAPAAAAPAPPADGVPDVAPHGQGADPEDDGETVPPFLRRSTGSPSDSRPSQPPPAPMSPSSVPWPPQAPVPPEPPRRNPHRDWAAPPPWADDEGRASGGPPSSAPPARDVRDAWSGRPVAADRDPGRTDRPWESPAPGH